jgi:hypothetical protein
MAVMQITLGTARRQAAAALTVPNRTPARVSRWLRIATGTWRWDLARGSAISAMAASWPWTGSTVGCTKRRVFSDKLLFLGTKRQLVATKEEKKKAALSLYG